MAEKLTPQQQQAVTDRGGNLLVSAAAGSGKTKVLVDRLISFLTDSNHPANIDDFLIITYTKAAASELREKIANKLTERIAEEPGNRHLHRQLQRLYLTTISTVHSFCADILRQYAYLLDIPGDFSVIDERDAFQLQTLAMEQVLEDAYSRETPDPDFLAFVESQGFHRNDSMVPKIIMGVSEKALCHLMPDAWLDACVRSAQVEGISDASQTPWGKYLMDDLKDAVALQIRTLRRVCDRISEDENFTDVYALFVEIICQLERLQAAKTWDEIIEAGNINFGRLKFTKKAKDSDLTEPIKGIKTACAEHIRGKLSVFCNKNEQVMGDLQNSAAAVRGLVGLVREYHRTYSRLKRHARVLDFSDLEHYTLDLFYGKRRTGVTAAAREVARRYRQIMVDEYQDSNAIQDAIFDALSQDTHNLFMVGDVKQSIYHFRMADPDIFLEKYNRFQPAGNVPDGEGRKVLLSSNFRSGGAVLDAANDVFRYCMSRAVGGLDYGPEEELVEGVPHLPLPEPEIRLLGLRVKNESNAQEARMVAQQIRQMLDGTHMIREGTQLRPMTADDIVILLRSPGTQGAYYKNALDELGISCWDGQETNLFDADEICVIRSLLTVISNPRQDIPLVATLASPVFGFTAEDLAALREKDRNKSVYELLQDSQLPKALHFKQVLNHLRKDAKVSSVSGLLEKIYLRTNLDAIYGAMEDGLQRMERLEIFYGLAVEHDSRNKGNLELFLSNLDIMEQEGLSLQPAQQPNSVRIYSIHKSKGLEFPVVFLCGLSKRFNTKDLSEKVLLDKELGIGLCCSDPKARICYPNIAKSAISVKKRRELISEEMRILYVAMTRPRDRLIMTFTFWNPDASFGDIAMRMGFSDPVLLHSTVNSMDSWVLYAALKRTEAGALFATGGYPGQTHSGKTVWDIQVIDAVSAEEQPPLESRDPAVREQADICAIRSALNFTYAHQAATVTPSKQTATQLKERYKDTEVSQNAGFTRRAQLWRTPSFMPGSVTAAQRGSAIHAAMQYVSFSECTQRDSLMRELQRLQSAGLLTGEQIGMIEPQQILDLFSTPLGKRLLGAKNIRREFKFSVLVSPEGREAPEDKILLQGVVDCAIMDQDGIVVIDFKTDHVTEETLEERNARYIPQVNAYAQALSQIFQMPVKEKYLYYFQLARAVPLP